MIINVSRSKNTREVHDFLLIPIKNIKFPIDKKQSEIKEKILASNGLNELMSTKVRYVIGVFKEPNNKTRLGIDRVTIVGRYKVLHKDDGSWSLVDPNSELDSYMNCEVNDSVIGLEEFNEWKSRIVSLVNPNPWDKNKIKNLGEEYIQYYKGTNSNDGNDFSWIPEDDKEKMQKIFTYGKKNRWYAGFHGLPWGIPNQVIGNPKLANVFLCMINPRTNTIESGNCSTLKEYISSEKKNNEQEYFDNSDKYYSHIVYDKDSNINGNILSIELRSLLENKDWKKEIANSKNVDEILKRQYYLYNYFNFLFRSDKESTKAVFEKIYSYGDKNLFDDLKLSDLELLPYRSDKSPLKNYVDANLLTSRYVAQLIIERINSIQDKPYFICKSEDDWLRVIEMYLLHYGLNNIELRNSDSNKTNNIKYYFYHFTSLHSQKASISMTNVSHEDNNEYINDSVYNDIKYSMGLTDVLKKMEKYTN